MIVLPYIIGKKKSVLTIGKDMEYVKTQQRSVGSSNSEFRPPMLPKIYLIHHHLLNITAKIIEAESAQACGYASLNGG